MNYGFLVTNDNDQDCVGTTLSRLASEADKVQVAVAFLSIADPIENWLKDEKAVELIVVLRPPTNPAILRGLVDSFPVNLEAKFYSARFHSKLFIFFKDGVPFCAQVGSSNHTGAGLYTNLETNVLIEEPVQLKHLAAHFRSAWNLSAHLEPNDIEAYKKLYEQTKRDREAVKKKEDSFEGRVVEPRINATKVARIKKEARDYVSFWKTVDGIIDIVGKISTKEWPRVPLYLSVDQFFEWLIREWDRKAVDEISSNSVVRRKRLPTLFAEFARWDKGGANYTGLHVMEKAEYFRNTLAKDRLPKLTPAVAREVYSSLYSGWSRTQRFGGDRKFATANSLTEIKRAFKYLLWSDADVQQRISSLLPGGLYHLKEFGPSNIQELIGWTNPSLMPLRNNKADAAVELLGYRFR